MRVIYAAAVAAAVLSVGLGVVSFGGADRVVSSVHAQLAQDTSVAEVSHARERSQKTVEHQIAGALRKLDFGDRREFIGYMKGVRGDPPAMPTSDEGAQSQPQSRETTKE